MDAQTTPPLLAIKGATSIKWMIVARRTDDSFHMPSTSHRRKELEKGAYGSLTTIYQSINQPTINKPTNPEL
jgi:hypothetical protein